MEVIKLETLNEEGVGLDRWLDCTCTEILVCLIILEKYYDPLRSLI